MKNVSPDLAIALAENLTYLCRLVTITRTDGAVFYFTDNTTNLVYGGEEYSSIDGFSASAVQNQVNATTNNVDIQFIATNTGVSREAVERGLFDDAAITVDLINYRAVDDGVMPMLVGTIRGAELPTRGSVLFHIFGTDIRTTRPICEQYSATCRAAFGDARCKVNLDLYTTAFVVGAAVTPQRFTAAALNVTDLYKLGRIEWLTGDNAGITSEVVTNDGAGNVYLKYRPPYPIQVGDTGNIVRGCMKTVAACEGYNNRANFRGEPYIPGNDGLKP